LLSTSSAYRSPSTPRSCATKNSPPRCRILGSDADFEPIADGKITLRNDRRTQEVFTFDVASRGIRTRCPALAEVVRDGATAQYPTAPTFTAGGMRRRMDALRGVRA
jgi:hypothetical protein